jgi:hypothetical protein
MLTDTKKTDKCSFHDPADRKTGNLADKPSPTIVGLTLRRQNMKTEIIYLEETSPHDACDMDGSKCHPNR